MKPSFCIKVLPLLLLAIILFSAETLFGQSHTLSGKITDERNRQPLAFVNVVINDLPLLQFLNGEYTTAQLQEEYKQIVQDALDNIFN